MRHAHRLLIPTIAALTATTPTAVGQSERPSPDVLEYFRSLAVQTDEAEATPEAIDDRIEFHIRGLVDAIRAELRAETANSRPIGVLGPQGARSRQANEPIAVDQVDPAEMPEAYQRVLSGLPRATAQTDWEFYTPYPTAVGTLNLDFAGGTLADFTNAIIEASDGEAPNFQVIGSAEQVPVLPLTLRDVTVQTALEVGVPLRSEAYAETGVAQVVKRFWENAAERPVVQFEIETQEPRQQEAQPIHLHRFVFDVSRLVGPGTSEYTQINAQRLVSACLVVFEGWPESPTFRIHEGTGLLVALIPHEPSDHLVEGVIRNLASRADQNVEQARVARVLEIASLGRDLEARIEMARGEGQSAYIKSAATDQSGTPVHPEAVRAAAERQSTALFELARELEAVASTLAEYRRVLDRPGADPLIALRTTADYKSLVASE
ncbi:MAG: hypothetical protein AAGB51_09505 [Planctomycetota bacterium]